MPRSAHSALIRLRSPSVIALLLALGLCLTSEPSHANRQGRNKVKPGKTIKDLKLAARQSPARVIHNVRKVKKLLLTKESRAQQQATKEIQNFTPAQLLKFGFKPGQEKAAIKSRARQIMARTERRLLRTATILEKLAKREVALGKKLDTAKAKGNAKKVDSLRKSIESVRQDRISISESGTLNAKLGVEGQVKYFAKALAQRKGLGKVIPKLKRDSGTEPGSDGKKTKVSTYREKRKAKRTSGDALFKGPWWKASKRPKKPSKDTILKLKDFRSLDADGMHASAFVTDPGTGAKWKLKFPGKSDGQHDPEATMSRLYYAMGYHTQPVYHYSSVKVEPNVVNIAAKHANKVGLRVPEKGGKATLLGKGLAKVGVKPGKFGYSPHSPYDLVSGAQTKSGRQLSAAATVRLLKKGAKNPRLLEGLHFVKLQGVNLMYKDGKDSSVGPWSPDMPRHIDQREVRAIGVLATSWAGAFDIRFPNLRLDVREKKNGKIELKHKLSDSGGALQLKNLSWTVNLKQDKGLNHTDGNDLIFKSLDRLTVKDATWGARQVAKLTEKQIMSAVAAGAKSWPVARLIGEKLVARRDSLVKQLGLTKEFGLLRPNGPNKKLNIEGAGKIELFNHKGKITKVIHIPRGDFIVRNGEIIEAPAGGFR